MGVKKIPKDEIKITKNLDTEQEKIDEAERIPKYLSKLELDEELKKRIIDEVFDEFDEIEAERRVDHLEEKWDALDDQYNGRIEEDEDRQFNLHKQTTKVKIDGISGAITEAFLDSDPIFSISPRPGGKDYAAMMSVSEKQQDFLDYKMDKVIALEKVMEKINHSASLKGTGILKWSHKIERIKRRREEIYEGIEGLKDFQMNYPDEDKVKGYQGYLKQLIAGKKINIVVEYYETTYNDPYPEYVDLKDFYVRTGTDGYDGLKTTRLIAERKEYTYWELKKLEQEPNGFYDIEELLKDKDGKISDTKQKEKFDVLECVYYYEQEENTGEYDRGVFWIEEKTKTMIGSINYPYYAIDSYYVPHYVKNKVKGFYQGGIGEDLTDSNIAEDALLNFMLEGAWLNNITTPITPEGSSADKQFLEKRWTHGVPLNAKKGEIDFLPKPNLDTMGLMTLYQTLLKGDDDVSGHSSLMTGRESEIDPTAPAAKTIALLERSGKNIKKYIKAMLPSFVCSAEIILNIYAQISNEGRDYAINEDKLLGENPFETISRSEMMSSTNIQARAMAFDFDKLSEKKEDIALYSLLRQEVLFSRNPEAVYAYLKNMVKGWSVKWRNLANVLLPPLEQIKQQQFKMMIQAIQVYIQQSAEMQKVTGQPMPLQTPELMKIASDLQAQIVNPTEEESGKTK